MTDNERHEQPQDIGCLQAIEMFYGYLDGELDEPGAVADFERHLAHCRSCFSREEFERLLLARLRSLAAQSAPDSLRGRLRILTDSF